MMKKFALAIPVLALVLGGTTACATKKFVHGQVGEVNDKVEGLSRSVEETQERTRANEGRIVEVDQRAEQAGRRADEAHAAADAVNARADAIEAASKRLIYEVVLSEDKGGFRFGQATMPDTAQQELDQLVQQLKAEPTGAYIEIEGHTDSTGPKDFNYRLGLQRAEAVKRYLYEQHQVPLHRINVISYGPDKPIAPNNSRDGRAQNRRVVIKILT
ncbi:MAG: OmpA family protein [Acidobacteria bacterium]|nr:OmpA family protein [Acidobacteriota bacterium]